MKQIALILQMIFNHQPAIKDLLYSASFRSESCLLLRQYLFCLGSQPVEGDSYHDFAWVAYEAYGAVVVALSEVSFLREGDD